jgi:diguanylate cyclase (GGDEF)-like protein
MIKLSNKNLAAIILIIIAVFAYLLFSGYHNVKDTHTQAKLIIEQQQKKHQLVSEMYKAARERSLILLTMHATDDLFELDDLHQQLSKHASSFINARQQLMAMDLSAEERSILDEQMSLVRINAPLQDQAADMFIVGNQEQAEKLLFETAIPGQQQVLNKTDDILAFYKRNTKKVIADIELSDENASSNFQRLAATLFIIGTLIALAAIRATRQEKSRLIRSAEKMSYQAAHDPLTGLINRWKFESTLAKLLKRIESDEKHFVFYLDLDQFKIVNDTGGHHVGDELLKQVATIMRSCIRKSDVLARIGGDEFGIILEYCDLDCARNIAESIVQKMREFRFYWEKNTFRIGVSIGMVQVDDTTRDLAEILKNIDSACYAAKDSGGNRFHVYSESDQELIHRKSEMDWVIHIESALEQNRFVLFAQPIVATNENDSHVNYELLIRMKSAEDELIPAGNFLPAAERYNKMIDIDSWVVTEALSILSYSPRFVESIDYCSINLSCQSLTNEKFMDFIIEQFNRHKHLSEKICFEITETAAITNLIQADRCILKLREMGIRFSLDDFGSGLASFEYLKMLPIDYLKIDGMFVRDIVTDPIDRAMVKSIHEVGSVMGKITVAEFVENQDILNEVKAIGVHFAQGYTIGRPMPFEQVIDQQENVRMKA